jgi:hypothetical protein
MLPESAWAADEAPTLIKANKATSAARNPGENRMVESPWILEQAIPVSQEV